MNTIFKNTKVPIGLILFSILSLFGCIFKAKTVSPFPESGELCFRTSALPDTEYIHMKFEGKSVSGKLYLEDETWGGYFIDFTGTLSSDTTMVVELALNNVQETEQWAIHLADNKMTLENSLKRAVLGYEVIDCQNMPDSKKYLSIEQMAEADEAENDDVAPLCYESVSSDAYKRTTLHEYIVFWNREGTITGNGSGYEEGEPAWNFNFSGSLIDDSTIEVKVNYTHEGSAPFTTSETWIMDDDNGLRLKDPVQGRPGAKTYFNIDEEDIPEAFQDLLKNE